MTDYTPTVAEVERLWMHGYDGTAGYPKAVRYEREARWHRFIASVKAEAWYEGVDAGEAWANWAEMDGNAKTEPSRENPYEKEAQA